MSASTTRQIGGVLLKPDGTPFANSSLTIYRDKRKVVPQGDAAIVDEVLRTVTGPDGGVSMALVPGQYLGQIRLSDADRYFQFTVPDGAGPFVIADLIETSPISGAQYLTLLDLVTTARAWAEKPEDEEVVENGYSALHWAAKAKDARDDAVAAKTDAQAAAVAAAGSASSAAGSASTASTQASNAANSASAAANAKTAAESARDAAINAKNDAQGYASDAQGYASAAAGSASSASTHATNAANSALAAAGSASAANDAKEYAEAARDEAVQAKEDAEAARDQANNIVGNLSGGLAGQFLVKNSNSDYDYGWANVSGGGDMLASIYDPTGVAADAFDMDNMVEGSTNLILTAAERTDIAANTSARHTHSNKSILDATEQAFTTALKNKLDGLGNAATRNVGTTGGTVAAGDDSRIVNARLISGSERIVTVLDNASTTWDAQNGRTEVAILTATGDRTITAPSNPVDGQRVVFVHTASGGDRTPTFSTGSGGFNLRGKTIGATPSGKTTYYGFIYSSAESRWNLLAVDGDTST